MNRSIDTSPVSGYDSFVVKVKNLKREEEDMRKVLSILIAVCLVLSLFTGVLASARADTRSGNFIFRTNGTTPQTVTITKYIGEGGKVTIPKTLNGYPVTIIGLDYGNSPFGNSSKLTNVTISNGITSIGHIAFAGCTGLTSITIPNSVISIGVSAFSGCSKLASVTIPNGVTVITAGVFEDCTALKRAIIGNKVNTIDYFAFENCTALTNVTIPKSVTKINDGAFLHCSKLTSIIIPSSVTLFGSGTFENCPKLATAYFLGNAPIVTELGSPEGRDMFKWCAPGFTVHYVSGTTGWSNPWYGYHTTTH
jgi:putative transposon-encoded protein